MHRLTSLNRCAIKSMNWHGVLIGGERGRSGIKGSLKKMKSKKTDM